MINNSVNVNKNTPIAVFDSGVGGISVLKELAKRMPSESFIYYGDTKNAPYGSKSHSEIKEYVLSSAEKLFSIGVKALVVACNTATSIAINNLREKYTDIPIIGIEPALKPAVMAKEHPSIIVMATPATLSEKKFREQMAKYHLNAEIIPLPAPRLAGFIEQGILDGYELDDYIYELFLPFKYKRIDSLVLGCTHYPFVKKEIVKYIGDDVVIYDGSEGTAAHTEKMLEENGLLADSNSKPSITVLSSGNAKDFSELFNKLYNMEL